MTTSQCVLDAGPMISTSDDFASLPAATDWVKVAGPYLVQAVGGAGTALASVTERSCKDPASVAGPAATPAPAPASEVGVIADSSARTNQFD